MDRFIVISGCSGGGKSTLLSELERRGYNVEVLLKVSVAERADIISDYVKSA